MSNYDGKIEPLPTYNNQGSERYLSSDKSDTYLWLAEENTKKAKQIKRLQEQIKKLQHYQDRAHKALCEISSLSEKEMDSGKAWDIAHNAILCLNEIKEGVK